MDYSRLVVPIATLVSLCWAGAIFFTWLLRPAVSLASVIRSLAFVGVVIVCTLAGMSTLNTAQNVYWWRVGYTVVGGAALAAAVHQTIRLYTTRYSQIDRRTKARGRGTRRNR
jgi:hypothetical protein